MNGSRPCPRRRAGVASATAALLMSAALGVGAPALPYPALADDAVGAPGGEATFADAVPAEGEPALGEGAAPAPEEPPAQESAPAPEIDPPIGEGAAPDATLELPVYAPEVGAPAGSATIGVRGAYHTADAQALLERVNAIRAEAAAEGIAVDGAPVSGAPLAWSAGLEYVAQIRAAETALNPALGGHRPTLAEGVTAAGDANTFAAWAIARECVGTGATGADVIEAWYQEKPAYLNYLATGDTSQEFGHYLALISDGTGSIGIGCFTAEGLGGATGLALELSATPSESADVRPDGAAVQQVNVAATELSASLVWAEGAAGPAAGGSLGFGYAIAYLPDATQTDLAPSTPVTLTSSDPNVFTVEGAAVRGVAAGTASLLLMQGETVIASLDVTVSPAVATGVQALAGIQTQAGTAPALPATALVNLSDGSVAEEAVVWDAIDPALYGAAGAFTATGVTANTGLAVTCEVAVVAAEPPSVADLWFTQDVWTTAGLAPALPETIHVVWSDGSESDEPVVWDAIDPALYGAREGGAFDVAGTAANHPDIVVAVHVTVGPAAIQCATWPEDIATTAGTAPVLPATVPVFWTNGDTTDEPVSWNAVDPALYAQEGRFEVNGTVGPEGGAWTVGVFVVVAPAPPAITGVADIELATPSGTAPTLPATVPVTRADGSVTDEPVTWNTVDASAFAAREGGTVEVPGTVTEWDAPVIARVTVEAATVAGVASPPDVATEAAIAPALPQTVQVTWSNGDVTDEPVAWDAVDANLYAAPGSFTATGTTVGGAAVSCTVTVAAASVAAVGEPAVSAPSGSAPVLPDTVEVTWSNGVITEETAVWDAIDPGAYTAREGGAFTVAGTVLDGAAATTAHVTVDPATAEVAPVPAVTTEAGTAPALPQTAQVLWSNGDVTDEAVTWDAVDPAQYANGGSFTVGGTVAAAGDAPVSCAVEVRAATIASVEEAHAATEAGSAPELPATVRVTWTNGAVTDEPVSWKEPEASQYAEAGTFTVSGIAGSGEQTAEATCTVEVSALTMASVEAPADVATEAGTAPALPATVRVTWSDGSTTDEPVAWDAVDPAQYARSAGATFTVNGMVEGWSKPVSITVNVAPATIASIEDPAAVSTPAGTKPVLPATVKATWTNGDTTEETVVWDELDPATYTGRAGGTFNLEGTVEGWSSPVALTLTVDPATATEAGALDPVATEVGIAPELPASVPVTWSNHDVSDEAVTWDEPDGALYAQPGSFTATGTVAAAGLDVTCTVEVKAPVIEGVGSPADVATPSGTAPKLPETLAVTWSNGTQTDEPVTWDAIDPARYSDRAGGAFEIAGTVAGWDNPVHLTITVEPATVASVAAPADVATASGTAPTLPETVTATWTNGDTTEEAVTWETPDAAAYQARAGGTFQLAGTVAGWADPVALTVTVSPATIVEVGALSAETNAGIAPALPETASVTWSNGDATEEAVAWAAPDAASYAKPGSFIVEGTVGEGDGAAAATCTVTVGAAVVAEVGTPDAVETYAGAAPELPATARVTWSDGSATDEPVTWDDLDAAAYAQPGSFTVGGAVGETGATVTATVNVRAMRVASIAAVDAGATPAGVAPELPATVTATWEDGSTTEEPVTWETPDSTLYATAGGTFEVAGFLDKAECAQGVQAVATVAVGDPVAVGVTDPAAVETIAGVAPQLPATADVALSDGTTVAEPVTWDAIAAESYHGAGSFTVVGTAAGLPVTATVNVAAPQARNAQGVSVITSAGTAPTLPQTVQVTWSNSTVTDEPVAWEPVAEALYQKAGVFKVRGTAGGMDVTAVVTVQAAEDIAPTGDATVPLPVLVGVGVLGVAAVVGGIAALVVRGRKNR